MSRNQDRINRNEFFLIVTTILGSGIAFILGVPAIQYLISPAQRLQEKDAWIPVGSLEEYPLGEPTRFNFTRSQVNGWEKTVTSYGVYILRKSEQEVEAFSDICTHLACKVSWHTDSQDYICPCHDGHFDINGNVTKGPPPRPLDQFETRVEDGNLSIHLVS